MFKLEGRMAKLGRYNFKFLLCLRLPLSLHVDCQGCSATETGDNANAIEPYNLQVWYC